MNALKFNSACPLLLAGVLAFLPASGNAQQAVPVRSTLHGQNKICFLAEPGKTVNKGEALVVFDPEAETQALHAAEAAVLEAEAKVRGIEAELAALTAGQEAKRKALDSALKEAARALERYQELDQPLTEKRLQQAVTDADAALRNEQEHCDSRDELLKQGAIRKSEWEEAGLKLQRAKLADETAHANLDAHLKYEKGPQTDTLSDVLHQKEETLKALETDLAKSKKTLDAGLAAAQARYATIQASRDRAKEQLKQTAVLASADGIFKPAAEPDSEAKLAPGSKVDEGQLLGTIEAK
jgi:multidrug resistance efflux pump